jgi:hypothetical protein
MLKGVKTGEKNAIFASICLKHASSEETLQGLKLSFASIFQV